jgi:hypothetical protein
MYFLPKQNLSGENISPRRLFRFPTEFQWTGVHIRISLRFDPARPLSSGLPRVMEGLAPGGLSRHLGLTACQFSVQEMKPGAGGANDAFIFVFSNVIVFVRPMLDVHRCRRAGENQMGHLSK